LIKISFSTISVAIQYGRGKSKVHPRTGHKGPEEEQLYSSTLPSTLALEEDGCSTPCPARFNPRKDPVPLI